MLESLIPEPDRGDDFYPHLKDEGTSYIHKTITPIVPGVWLAAYPRCNGWRPRENFIIHEIGPKLGRAGDKRNHGHNTNHSHILLLLLIPTFEFVI